MQDTSTSVRTAPPEDYEAVPRLIDGEPFTATVEAAVEDLRNRGDFALLPAGELKRLVATVLAQAARRKAAG